MDDCSHIPYYSSIPAVFGQAKLCKYNGQYYCFDCHLDDERVIPARVLFNWDFRKHKVSVASCEFLDSIEYMPVLNIEEVNKALYVYIPQMEEALVSLVLASVTITS